jgi:hypothetical protein
MSISTSPTVKNPFGNVKKGDSCPVAASLRDKTVFDFRSDFDHAAPMGGTLSASDSRPRLRRAKSDFLLGRFPISSFRGGFP